jgi:hypothetical protein
MQGNTHLHSRYRNHTTASMARSTAGIATTMSASMEAWIRTRACHGMYQRYSTYVRSTCHGTKCTMVRFEIILYRSVRTMVLLHAGSRNTITKPVRVLPAVWPY